LRRGECAWVEQKWDNRTGNVLLRNRVRIAGDV
jgi:hypothetical protein